MNSLREMTNSNTSRSAYYETTADQIRISEENTDAVYNVLCNEFTNPFMVGTSKHLLHLSSGVPVSKEVSRSILSLDKEGEKLYQSFRRERLLSKSTELRATIKKNSYKGFDHRDSSSKSKQATKCSAEGLNRNILGLLHSFSLNNPGQHIDYEKALGFPLCSTPLAICNTDGNMRKAAKSDLKRLLLEDTSPDEETYHTLIIDLIPLFHQLTNLPETYERVARAIIALVHKTYAPKKVERIDLVADNYIHDVSTIKDGEHSARGCSEQIEMKSLHVKTAQNFHVRILKNPDNKARLVQLLFQYIRTNKQQVLTRLGCSEINLSAETSCISITQSSEARNESLISNQPEVDTRIMLYAAHALKDQDQRIAIWSPSGDTDIIVLAIALLDLQKERVTIIDGRGENRKIFKLSSVEIEDDFIDCLLGFHAFTGNDYVSSFFRKGKKSCYKLLQYQEFRQLFGRLGNSIDQEQIDVLLAEAEKFLCKLYCVKRCNDVNQARYKIFHDKMLSGCIIDLSTVPPCKSVLKLHLYRSAYVAHYWKRSKEANLDFLPISDFGWNGDGSVRWIESEYPSDVESILMDEDCNRLLEEDDYVIEEHESDDE